MARNNQPHAGQQRDKPGAGHSDARYKHCQIRIEGEKAHSYHRNGKYIGTLTTRKMLG
jgi:hypothetical protein